MDRHETSNDSSAEPVDDGLVRSIAEHSKQGLALLDNHGYCVYVNQAMVDMTGYSAQELLSAPFHDLVHHHHPDGSPFPKEDCKLHYIFLSSDVGVHNDEFVYFRKDGTQFLADCSTNPIRHGAQTLYTALEMRDVTAIRQAENDAREHELAHWLAVEAGRIGTWERDMTSDLVNISPMMAQIIDLPPEQNALSSKQWRELIAPDDLEMIDQIVTTSVMTNKPFEMEYRLRLRSGRTIWVLARGIVVKDAKGNPIRATGATIDITEKKEAEDALRASEERYRLLADLSPDAILVHAGDRYVYANQSAARMFGVDNAHAIVGRSAFDFFDPEHHDSIRMRQAMVLGMKKTLQLVDLRIRRRDGVILNAQANAAEVAWGGRPAIQIILRDVTELKQAQSKLRIMNERLKLAIEGAGEGIWDWDIASNTYTFSGGLKKMFGWAAEEDLGDKIDWQKIIHPDDVPRVMSAMQSCLEGKTPIYQCEFRLIARDNRWKWVLSRGVIVDRDADQKPIAMTGTVTDITARKESDELVWRHANLDALTGLPNRRLFRERLDVDLRKAHRNGRQLSLLFIDLDGFKQVNDLFGHDAGDLLLMEATYRIKGCVRETDTVARLGGDEFTVVLTDLENTDHVEFVCQKILASLSRPFQMGKEFAYISGSIGVVLSPLDATTSDELVRKADQAMYAAKNSGKNQFSYFTQSMDEKAHMRLRLTNELRHALQAGQLSVHYQPVVHLAHGNIVKAEALLRWQHPKLGAVEPSTFIPLAEQAGLISSIGDWVFREAATWSKRWSEQTGMPFQIGVNKSPLQFMSHERESDWLAYLSDLGLPGSSISIEITEGLLLHAAPNITDQLLEYRDAGIQVAIDDFGTGYSSMAYLQKFDIDYLKIDQSFVRDIETNVSNRTIAETIIMMAHKLGLQVIAEGIETQEQLDCLLEAGCDYGQGFLFSRPVPASEFEQMLAHPPLARRGSLH